MGEEIAPRAAEPDILRLRTQQFRFVLAMIESDLTPPQLARKLAKGDPRKAKAWRMRYQRWRQDPEFEKIVASGVSGQMVMGLPQAANALIRRAAKGNVPAIKLLMEATGFYSPKTQVDHTGEIAITIKGTTRPPAVEDEQIAEATVVED